MKKTWNTKKQKNLRQLNMPKTTDINRNVDQIQDSKWKFKNFQKTTTEKTDVRLAMHGIPKKKNIEDRKRQQPRTPQLSQMKIVGVREEKWQNTKIAYDCVQSQAAHEQKQCQR